jgi:hypothetical protein
MLLEVIERALGYLIAQALLMTFGVVLISFPALVLILLGYVQIRSRKIGLPHHFLVFLLAAFLFPVGEALIGSAAYDTQSEVATNVSLLLLGLSFLFTVATTVTAKGRRLFVFGIGCAFTIWTFWARFVAQMSIANSWL